MTERLDPYGTWGDWDLQRFKVEIARWRDTTHPTPEAYMCVDRWWPNLKQPSQRTGAVPVSREYNPDGNLWWMWVPGAQWLDEQDGYVRVQCFFRVYRHERPPRLVCDEFRTRQSMNPTEADRADGMG